ASWPAWRPAPPSRSCCMRAVSWMGKRRWGTSIDGGGSADNALRCPPYGWLDAGPVGRTALFRPPLRCAPRLRFGGQRVALLALRLARRRAGGAGGAVPSAVAVCTEAAVRRTTRCVVRPTVGSTPGL